MDGVAQLEVRRDGEVVSRVSLDTSPFSIGRASASFQPDLALEDPDAVISRLHCTLTLESGSWRVEDRGSRNGTHVRRRGDQRRIDGPVQLGDGDVVVLQASSGSDTVSFWELVLLDPSSTRTVAAGHAPRADQDFERPAVRWMPSALRLEVVGVEEPFVVELRRQGYTLIDHMVRRNDDDGDAVVCTTDELLEAVWGPRSDWDRFRPPTPENLRDLVSAVRRAIEPDPNSPVILENRRGIGYLLHSARA